MKHIFRTLFITAFLLPVTVFGATCTAPLLVQDFITQLEGEILVYQRDINADGNQCTTLVRRDADLGTVFETQMQNINNTSQAAIIDFLGDVLQPQDFLDDFMQVIPLLDRPYALNYDLERVQERMDRLWNLQIRAHSMCQTERAGAMRNEWSAHFETMRQLRNALQPRYQGQINPFYIGFPEDDSQYTVYRQTGYYNHPTQRACSSEELNVEQIAKKLQRISDTFMNAGKEVEHEFKTQITGVQSAWTELDRRAQELKKRTDALFAQTPAQEPQKTMNDILQDIRGAEETAPVSARALLEANSLYQEQYRNYAQMTTLRTQIEALYTNNTHASLRIQETELDQIVRMLLALDGTLEKNVGSIQNICGQQATDIPCPSPQ